MNHFSVMIKEKNTVIGLGTSAASPRFSGLENACTCRISFYQKYTHKTATDKSQFSHHSILLIFITVVLRQNTVIGLVGT
jgi:hypothetical protein